MTPETVRVLGVAASARPDSTSGAALDVALDRVRLHGCGVERLRLPDLTLPFCNGDKTDPWPDHPSVERFRHAVTRADAVILATPEYHGGMSGALKNALDLLDFPHTEGKVFAAVSALGGRSNSNAINQIRTSVRWLHGWMVPDQVAIPDGRRAQVDGVFTDPTVVPRLEQLADTLVMATVALAGGRHRPAGLLLVAQAGAPRP